MNVIKSYSTKKNSQKTNIKNKKKFDDEVDEEKEDKENDSISGIKSVSSKNHSNNLMSDENDDKFNNKDMKLENKNNSRKKIKDIKSNDVSNNESININKIKSKEKYSIDELLKKLNDKENELNEKNIIINELKKEIEEKENKIKLITKTNTKLKQSLDEFSKKVDEKLFNRNYFNKFRKSKYNSKNNDNYDVELKKKELDNAMNIIKILKNDNQRLQSTVDNYEKYNKLKDLENINIKKEDQNINLENQIKFLKIKLNNYNLILKKNKIYENQIEILNKENKSYKDNNKLLKNKLSRQVQKSNSSIDLNENNNRSKRNISFSPKIFNKIIKGNIYEPKTDRYTIDLNDKYNSLNNKEGYHRLNNKISSLNKSINSLPTIKNKINYNDKNNILNGGLDIYRKNYDQIKIILKTFFNEEEIVHINKIFEDNINGFEAFKLKLYIINKSKETLNKKYNLEIKKYNERIISAQQQIEYLNNKIRESEVNNKVLQTQMNELNIQKKLLLKKIKKLETNLIEKDNILKLNFSGEEINNKNGQKDNDTIKNTEEDGSSKIALEEDSNDNNNN